MNMEYWIGRINGYLMAMEEINETESTKMFFQFQEIPWLGDMDKSLTYYYQNDISNVRLIGDTVDILSDSFHAWFFEKLSRRDNFKETDSRCDTFKKLLKEFFQSRPISIYECEFPFDFVGVFSEHFFISDKEKGFVLQFSMV